MIDKASKRDILVSVIMITYGHELFIQQAIESVLNQKLSEPYELIVCDDCSPDSTQKIVRRLAVSHPNGDSIKYVRHKYNIGMNKNYLYGVRSARGKFIAVCEGDDYWVDDLKLQKQVDLLNKEPEISFVFTPAYQLEQATGSIVKVRNEYHNFVSSNFTFEQILKLGGGFYPTCTSIYRKEILNFERLDEFLCTHSAGDYPVALLASIHGKIGFIKDVTAVYRIQTRSVTNSIFRTCKECFQKARNKHIQNLNFITLLDDILEIRRSDKIWLISKENYVLFSKSINCGIFLQNLRKFLLTEMLILHKVRVVIKFVVYYFSGRYGKSVAK
jgi:glycosyltransferase involved in cell wall biosynthesis